MADNQTGIGEWISKSKNALPGDMLLSCNFLVFVNGLKLGFSKVSNIENSIETESLAEGGVNTYSHLLFKSVTRERTLVLERGIVSLVDMNPAQMMLLGALQVGARIPVPIMVGIKTPDNKIGRLYSFSGTVVKKWSCGDLDAMNGQVLVERFELGYETMQEEQLTGAAIGLLGSL